MTPGRVDDLLRARRPPASTAREENLRSPTAPPAAHREASRDKSLISRNTISSWLIHSLLD